MPSLVTSTFPSESNQWENAWIHWRRCARGSIQDRLEAQPRGCLDWTEPGIIHSNKRRISLGEVSRSSEEAGGRCEISEKGKSSVIYQTEREIGQRKTGMEGLVKYYTRCTATVQTRECYFRINVYGTCHVLQDTVDQIFNNSLVSEISYLQMTCTWMITEVWWENVAKF